jgi:hypothetical protein
MLNAIRVSASQLNVMVPFQIIWEQGGKCQRQFLATKLFFVSKREKNDFDKKKKENLKL